MRHLHIFIVIVFGLSACAPVSRVPNIDNKLAAAEAEKQLEFAFKEEVKLKSRLSNISWPLLAANADLCKEKTTLRGGFNFASQENMPAEMKAVFAKIYGSSAQPIITAVYNQSPAWNADLRIGDQIIALEGNNVTTGKEGVEFLNHQLPKVTTSYVLTVKRDGVNKEININPVKACDYKIYVANDDKVNAFADGEGVVVNSGMMRFLGDDNELALIVIPIQNGTFVP